jgi:hypothetical protein
MGIARVLFAPSARHARSDLFKTEVTGKGTHNPSPINRIRSRGPFKNELAAAVIRRIVAVIEEAQGIIAANPHSGLIRAPKYNSLNLKSKATGCQRLSPLQFA